MALMEPLEHVLAVEGLRQQYRPQHIRVLVIAESHVRVNDARMARSGPAYLYNSRYYTPWWRYLLGPAYGLGLAAGVEERLRGLETLQAQGFWVLDACIVAMSGYGKLGADCRNRPFDSIYREMLTASWHIHVGHQLAECLDVAAPPRLVVMESVARVLPELRTRAAALIRFPARANAARYAQVGYSHGTEAFRSLVQACDSAGGQR